MAKHARIRLLTVNDIPLTMRLSSLAGWNQTADDWGILLELAPRGCFCIDIHGEPVATATLLLYGRWLGWIGMVLTHPNHRRQGLARQLLEHVLVCADSLAIRTLKLDATDQGQSLYQSLGFKVEQAVERWSRPALAAPRRKVAGLSGELRNRPEIDMVAFEADRSELLAKLEHRGNCFANARGFLFTRPGRSSAYLGPCIATEVEAADDLLLRALENPSVSQWSWDLLPRNCHAVALATKLGFTPQRRLTRMIRGADLRGFEDFVYAIAGFEFG